MENVNILFVSVGFFLCTSHLFVQTLPIKYHEKNSKANAAPIQKDAMTTISNSPALNNTVGLVMFPMLAEGEKSVKHLTKPKKLGDRSPDSYDSSTRQTEMTVAIRYYKTDAVGNYLFGKTQNADDNVDHEEEVNVKPYNRGNPSPKPRAPAAQRRAYEIPDSTVGVCAHRSTIYNFPKQIRYLKPRLYHRIFAVRPVWLDLRQEIYKEGKSQECHQPNMTDWGKYINCAIMRNMRMEYLVPKYPLHQHGGYFFPRNDKFD